MPTSFRLEPCLALGIKLPPKLGHGAFDAAVRDIIEIDETLSHALLRRSVTMSKAITITSSESESRGRYEAHVEGQDGVGEPASTDWCRVDPPFA